MLGVVRQAIMYFPSLTFIVYKPVMHLPSFTFIVYKPVMHLPIYIPCFASVQSNSIALEESCQSMVYRSVSLLKIYLAIMFV